MKKQCNILKVFAKTSLAFIFVSFVLSNIHAEGQLATKQAVQTGSNSFPVREKSKENRLAEANLAKKLALRKEEAAVAKKRAEKETSEAIIARKQAKEEKNEAIAAQALVVQKIQELKGKALSDPSRKQAIVQARVAKSLAKKEQREARRAELHARQETVEQKAAEYRAQMQQQQEAVVERIANSQALKPGIAQKGLLNVQKLESKSNLVVNRTEELKFAEENGVRYGDCIRLRHNATNMYLTGGSDAKGGRYTHPGSSKQYVVFGAAAQDEDTIWIIKGQHADGDSLNYEYGELVKNGSNIRFENASTGGNLHAHNLPSPITRQGEVTSYGVNGLGDSNDNWNVFQIKDNHSYLSYGIKTKFMHLNVQSMLHSHANLMNETNKWHEVTTYKYRDDNDWFVPERIEVSHDQEEKDKKEVKKQVENTQDKNERAKEKTQSVSAKTDAVIPVHAVVREKAVTSTKKQTEKKKAQHKKHRKNKKQKKIKKNNNNKKNNKMTTGEAKTPKKQNKNKKNKHPKKNKKNKHKKAKAPLAVTFAPDVEKK